VGEREEDQEGRAQWRPRGGETGRKTEGRGETEEERLRGGKTEGETRGENVRETARETKERGDCEEGRAGGDSERAGDNETERLTSNSLTVKSRLRFNLADPPPLVCIL